MIFVDEFLTSFTLVLRFDIINMLLSSIIIISLFSASCPLPFKMRMHYSNNPQYCAHSVKDIDKDLMCFGCKLAVNYIKWLAKRNYSPSVIGKEIETVCRTLNIEDEVVCTGVTVMFSEQVVYVLKNTNETGDVICDMFLGNCLNNNYINDWNLDDYLALKAGSKPSLNPPEPVPENSKKIKFLYISDMYFDAEYVPKSNADCGLPLCCRGRVIEDVSKQAGFWGDYRNCDSPMHTIDDMFDHIAKEHQDIDYIIWTGDLTPHNIWNQTRFEHIQYVERQTEVFKNFFKKISTAVPVYPVVGNHESVPVNTFSLPGMTNKYKMDWLYDSFAENWRSTGLPESTISSIKKGSYFYVDHVKQGLRIISLNMNFCNNLNFWLLYNSTDPGNQLRWLIDLLTEAEQLKMAVHIIGHIQPGSADCLKGWSWMYYKIVNRFEDTIRAQFFGHTHSDQFQLFFNLTTDLSKPHRPVSVAYTGPSVTPFQQLNPGYRIFEVDGRSPENNGTYTVLNHHTYILNLTEANASNETNWKLEYSARSAYNMDRLQPDDWYALVEKMRQNFTLFDQFYLYKFKSHPLKMCEKEDNPEKCRSFALCNLLTGRSYDPYICKHLNVKYYNHVIYNYAFKDC